MLEVLDNNMVGAMRVVSVERGIDPGELVLVPFGGAGPLHGSALARLMGCKTILVPPAPGVLSALGLQLVLVYPLVSLCRHVPPCGDVSVRKRVGRDAKDGG